MDARSLYPSQTYGLGRVFMGFRFQTNNASSPLLSSVDGVTASASTAPPLPVVTSLTRTAAGVIVVQLSANEKFNKVINVFADLDDTVDDGAYATCGNVTNEGSATAGIAFTIRTRAGATTTKTDYAARLVYVSIEFRNTTAGK